MAVRESSSSAFRFEGHSFDVCGLRWSGGGNLLASGGNDSCVFIWDRRSSKHLHKLVAHSAAVRALAWSPHQHNLLASGGGTADRTIKFWNTQTAKCCSTLDAGSQVRKIYLSISLSLYQMILNLAVFVMVRAVAGLRTGMEQA